MEQGWFDFIVHYYLECESSLLLSVAMNWNSTKYYDSASSWGFSLDCSRGASSCRRIGFPCHEIGYLSRFMSSIVRLEFFLVAVGWLRCRIHRRNRWMLRTASMDSFAGLVQNRRRLIDSSLLLSQTICWLSMTVLACRLLSIIDGDSIMRMIISLDQCCYCCSTRNYLQSSLRLFLHRRLRHRVSASDLLNGECVSSAIVFQSVRIPAKLYTLFLPLFQERLVFLLLCWQVCHVRQEVTYCCRQECFNSRLCLETLDAFVVALGSFTTQLISRNDLRFGFPVLPIGRRCCSYCYSCWHIPKVRFIRIGELVQLELLIIHWRKRNQARDQTQLARSIRVYEWMTSRDFVLESGQDFHSASYVRSMVGRIQS